MDNTADMLLRIKNALNANKKNVNVVCSKKNVAILKVLKEEGYIEDFNEEEVRPQVKLINVALKYKYGTSAIRKLRLRSKQKRREYSQISNLPLVFNGLGISIVSTSQGVMSDNEARMKNIGGEVICEVF